MGTSSNQTRPEYQIKEARNGSPIPVINGVHLHSSYNPQREAEAFVEKNLSTLEKHRHILLLGLGFAYHLDKALEVLAKNHGNDCQIVVIEPNAYLLEEAKEWGRLPSSKNVIYYTTTDIAKLYSQKELIDFLVDHPGILMHPASFNLNRQFFERFLSWNAKNTIEEAHELPLSDEVQSFLDNYQDYVQFNELSENIRTAKEIHELGHLFMGIQNMKQSSFNERTENEV